MNQRRPLRHLETAADGRRTARLLDDRQARKVPVRGAVMVSSPISVEHGSRRSPSGHALSTPSNDTSAVRGQDRPCQALTGGRRSSPRGTRTVTGRHPPRPGTAATRPAPLPFPPAPHAAPGSQARTALSCTLRRPLPRGNTWRKEPVRIIETTWKKALVLTLAALGEPPAACRSTTTSAELPSPARRELRD